MKNKIKKISLFICVILTVLVGISIGGVAAYAHLQGPFDLPTGWSQLPSGMVGHYVSGYYSFLQNASFYSNGSDYIYVGWVRQWGGWTQDPNTEYSGTYMWADEGSYDIIPGYAGNPVQGYDYTAYTYLDYDVEEYLTFGQRIWGWYPMFFDNMEYWEVIP